jgi:hypothetical protein
MMMQGESGVGGTASTSTSAMLLLADFLPRATTSQKLRILPGITQIKHNKNKSSEFNCVFTFHQHFRVRFLLSFPSKDMSGGRNMFIVVFWVMQNEKMCLVVVALMIEHDKTVDGRQILDKTCRHMKI